MQISDTSGVPALTHHDAIALLARTRAALSTPDHHDSAARTALIGELAAAEAQLAASSLPWAIEVHLGIIEHRNGVDFHAALSHPELLQIIATYARSWWNEIDDARDPAGLSDAEVVDVYFEDHCSEGCVTTTVSLDPIATAAAKAARLAIASC